MTERRGFLQLAKQTGETIRRERVLLLHINVAMQRHLRLGAAVIHHFIISRVDVEVNVIVGGRVEVRLPSGSRADQTRARRHTIKTRPN